MWGEGAGRIRAGASLELLERARNLSQNLAKVKPRDGVTCDGVWVRIPRFRQVQYCSKARTAEAAAGLMLLWSGPAPLCSRCS